MLFNSKIKEPQIREDIRNYLNQVQGVITRLANYNHSCKNYSILIFSAYATVMNTKVIETIKELHILIKLIFIFPFIVLWILDIYYIILERNFKNMYNSYAKLVKEALIKKAEIYNKVIENLYSFNYKKNNLNTNMFFIIISSLLYVLEIIFIIIINYFIQNS